MLTTMGPRTSRPILRVLGMATRIPPKISKHLTKAIKPLPPIAPQKRAGGEPGSGAGNGGSKGAKKLIPKITNAKPSRTATMLGICFMVIV